MYPACTLGSYYRTPCTLGSFSFRNYNSYNHKPPWSLLHPAPHSCPPRSPNWAHSLWPPHTYHPMASSHLSLYGLLTPITLWPPHTYQPMASSHLSTYGLLTPITPPFPTVVAYGMVPKHSASVPSTCFGFILHGCSSAASMAVAVKPPWL